MLEGKPPALAGTLDVVLLEGGCEDAPGVWARSAVALFLDRKVPRTGKRKSSRCLLCVHKHMSARQFGMCAGSLENMVCQPAQIHGVEGRGLDEVGQRREGRALGILSGLEEEPATKPREDSASRRKEP